MWGFFSKIKSEMNKTVFCEDYILKEISPGIYLEGMMLKLKLQTLATSFEELTHWKRL